MLLNKSDHRQRMGEGQHFGFLDGMGFGNPSASSGTAGKKRDTKLVFAVSIICCCNPPTGGKRLVDSRAGQITNRLELLYNSNNIPSNYNIMVLLPHSGVRGSHSKFADVREAWCECLKRWGGVQQKQTPSPCYEA